MPEMGESGEPGEQPVQDIPVSALTPNPHQPRKQFQEKQLKELAQSIKEKGIIQPLIVDIQNNDSYIIIAGERRYRAAQLAGLDTVPVIVKTFTEEERLEIGLIENVQREDLNAIEEAQGYRSLMNSFGYTQEDIAKKIGKSRSAIANTLRLLQLPEIIQEGILEHTITAGHARTLLAIDQEHRSQATALYMHIVDEGLSVRATEQAVRKINTGKGDELEQRGGGDKFDRDQKKTPELTGMEESLIRKLGTKVEVKGSQEKGKIEIRYYTVDDLNRLYDLLLND